jgi:hypothetical protein
VLLSDSRESDSGSLLQDGAGFILHKPLEESELETVLAEVESPKGFKPQ